MSTQPEKRDPRTDPRRGDVLRKNGPGRDREVSERYEYDGQERVAYVGDWCCEPTVKLASWRAWARNAEVVTVAGEAGE